MNNPVESLDQIKIVLYFSKTQKISTMKSLNKSLYNQTKKPSKLT